MRCHKEAHSSNLLRSLADTATQPPARHTGRRLRVPARKQEHPRAAGIVQLCYCILTAVHETDRHPAPPLSPDGFRKIPPDPKDDNQSEKRRNLSKWCHSLAVLIKYSETLE
ncbi:hypothetical protein EYF80_026912 [Liparis tanakae]|uniref:Uncharacterized protein n=1 Tax=Liparis tanakae TaxID=230148 RepID=A0A4Z2HAA8_9TELE|nr:hypothetical protein EYF80_026912 [Liparis tanakae]